MIEQLLYGNSPRDALVAAAVALGLLLAVFLVKTLLRMRLRTASETESDLDDFFLDVVNRTRLALLFLPAVYVASFALYMPSDIALALRTLARLSLIAQAGFWSVEVVELFLRRYRRRRVETDPAAITTINAFRYASLVLIWCVVVLVALDNLGVNITTLVTGLGIGGVAVALALQNILGDLFASLSIVLDKPFVVGDPIRVDKDSGVVEQIGLKTTRVRSVNGEELIFGNGDLLRSRIRNFRRMAERRVAIQMSVARDTPAATLARIPAMVRPLVERAEARYDRGNFVAISDRGFDFEFAFYVQSPDGGVAADLKERVLLDILRELEKEGIRLAEPRLGTCSHPHAENAEG